jgi:hypothetical protein
VVRRLRDAIYTYIEGLPALPFHAANTHTRTSPLPEDVTRSGCVEVTVNIEAVGV